VIDYIKLKNLIEVEPASISGIFQEINICDDHIDDCSLDKILGIESKRHERKIDLKKITQLFGIEQYKYEGTPYNYIRYFLNLLKPGTNDTIYDLGCGYGRVVLYGALSCPSKFKGIEIIPERVMVANQIKMHFSIGNARFKQGNVLDFSYADGNIFFLFNPFQEETLAAVGNRLQKISMKKSLKIVTWGGSSNDFFSQQNWLKEIKMDEKYDKIQIFQSI